MKRFLAVLALALGFAASASAQGTPGPTPPGAVATVQPVERADAAKAVAHSHTTGATLTLSAGTAGSPTQSIYVDSIEIDNCQGTAVTPAAPTFITSTGINGAPQFMVGSGPAAAGTCSPVTSIPFTAPLKSATPGTNVTFVLPSFITNQTISMNVYYHLGY